MGLARRGREGRRRRCRDIDDDERQRDRPQPPSAQRVGAGWAHLFVAPPRRCLDIDSSSRLDLGSVALPTNVIVFLKVSTKDGLDQQDSLFSSLVGRLQIDRLLFRPSFHCIEERKSQIRCRLKPSWKNDCRSNDQGPPMRHVRRHGLGGCGGSERTNFSLLLRGVPQSLHQRASEEQPN